MSAFDFLTKLRNSGERREGVLLNTTVRDGVNFWYQLRGEDGKIHLQFKAAGWLNAMTYIRELNREQKRFYYVVTGTVEVPCKDFKPRIITPECSD